MRYFQALLPVLFLFIALIGVVLPNTADAAMYSCEVMCSADGSPGTDPCADPQPQTVITSDPMSTTGSCTDYSRPNWCGSYCTDITPPPTCADQGQQGTYPNCYTPPPPPTCADQGQQGTYPNCYNPPTCADYGQQGTYPNCYTPPQPTCADYGQLGTYPNCYNPPTCADYGQQGTYPNCYNAPTCADYGQLGTYPNCYNPPQPTCADYGQQGTYPNCYYPPAPTCADYGQWGTYPNCYTPTCQQLGNCPVPPPTCADYGQQGTYPNCYNAPTCADYGQQGNYPYCYAYPTCADYGQSGTYPDCYSACVWNEGQSCSSSNSCGEANYGSVNCDGSCSASAPSESSCYPSASASCYPSSSIVAPGETVTWNASYSGFSGTPTISWSNPYGSPSSGSGQSTSFNSTYASAGQYAPSISVSGSSSASASCSPVTVADASCPISPELTLAGNPSRVRTGQASTISYSFTNVPTSSSCTLTENGSVISSRIPSSCGQESVSVSRTINTQTTYRLTCDSQSKEFIINVIPNIVEF